MVYLGIDIGGTNIAAGVVDEQNKIVVTAKTRTKMGCSPEETAEQVAQTAIQVLENAGYTWKEIPWIGVGCPGAVNRETGRIEYINNIPQLIGFPMRDFLEGRLNKKTFVENDANAAAYGEYKAGALRGAKDALAITLGTGVGSGILVGGEVYAGSNFAGGEIGHMVIQKGGRRCTCGRYGCWETYSSASGLILSTKESMIENPDSEIIWSLVDGEIEKVDGRTAFDAMRAGDSVGKRIVAQYISWLACGITNCINIFQPDILCIGGGICNEGETLLTPLRKLVAEEVYSKHSEKQTVICRAQLGNDAGIIGAALAGC